MQKYQPTTVYNVCIDLLFDVWLSDIIRFASEPTFMGAFRSIQPLFIIYISYKNKFSGKILGRALDSARVRGKYLWVTYLTLWKICACSPFKTGDKDSYNNTRSSNNINTFQFVYALGNPIRFSFVSVL